MSVRTDECISLEKVFIDLCFEFRCGRSNNLSQKERHYNLNELRFKMKSNHCPQTIYKKSPHRLNNLKPGKKKNVGG